MSIKETKWCSSQRLQICVDCCPQDVCSDSSQILFVEEFLYKRNLQDDKKLIKKEKEINNPASR